MIDFFFKAINSFIKQLFKTARVLLPFLRNIESEQDIAVEKEFSRMAESGYKPLEKIQLAIAAALEGDLDKQTELVEYCQKEIALATFFTRIVYRKNREGLEVFLLLDEGYYINEDETSPVKRLFGKTIYSFFLFIFFYIFLSLTPKKHQTYLTAKFTDKNQQFLYTTIVGGFIINEDKIYAINRLIEAMDRQLNFYQDKALNNLRLTVTKIDSQQANYFILNKEAYKPNPFLIKKYLAYFSVFDSSD